MSYIVLNPGSGRAVEVSQYANAAALPPDGYPGSLAITLDLFLLYILNATTGTWELVGASGAETDPLSIHRDNSQAPVADISWGGFRLTNLALAVDPGDAVSKAFGDVQYAPAATSANTALSNLASVAINTSLLPAVDGGASVGSAIKRFANTTISGVLTIGDPAGTFPITRGWFVGDSVDGTFGSAIRNTNTGGSAASSVAVMQDYPTGKYGELLYLNSGYTPNFSLKPNTLALLARGGAVNGISIMTFAAPGTITLDTNGNFTGLITMANGGIPRMTIDGSTINMLLGVRITESSGTPFTTVSSLDTRVSSQFINTSLGTSAFSQIMIGEDTASRYGSIYYFNRNFSPSGLFVPNQLAINSFNATGGLLLSTSTTGPIVFGTNDVERARIDTTDLATTVDVSISAAGKGLKIKTGSNSKIGQSVLVAGTVVVANTSVTPNSRIFLSVSSAAGVQGALSYAASAGVGFTINSTSAAETSTVAWLIVESIP